MHKLIKYNSSHELATAAAERFIAIADESIKERNQFVVALSGGNTPNEMYKLLAQPDYSSRIDWHNTFVFWGDERCVPVTDKDNNSTQARRTLLDHVNIPPENIFAIPVDFHPQNAAAYYEQEIRQFFHPGKPEFDLVLLGMGTNGHTASLFPHTEVLHEKDALVKDVFIPGLNMHRITMTAPLINAAKQKIFLVAGEEKKPMIDLVLNGAYLPDEYPAQMIKDVEWMVSVKS